MELNKLEREIADRFSNFAVTPCVGVWIEILWNTDPVRHQMVTPCVGVWIEIQSHCCSLQADFGHSPCGNLICKITNSLLIYFFTNEYFYIYLLDEKIFL